ncbi:MAG: Polyphosphate glucokinase [Parcubacteria bacterium C7867-004]|nr:MAG: Polyphosphate glucokinase [Parcubacteria bacterium C7867-004]
MSRLVFDIGGTHTRIAIAENGVLTQLEKVPTPQDPKEAVELMRAYALAQGVHLTDIVGGIAGVVADGVIVRCSPYLPQWQGFDMRGELSKALTVPVQVYNDAELAALGETLAGAGKGHGIVGYLTIGTGVGGALIVNGGPVPHVEGHEPGKQVLDYESGATLESLVGGTALAAEFGMPASELPRAVYEERTSVLATGIYNTIRIWSPDIFILNGPLMNDENGFVLEEVSRELAKIAGDVPMPPLAHAALGDLSGLTGAMLR